ncbi:TRM11 family SAM-dependent methyltransferase [Neobacillus niacini]|uniref:TRM11 family SAM-dependent methyltransferase n=1 Tax=Neobacillus niacini TaxID=86668 RepID=UPI00052F64F3|nr:RNA methyltransferase [Neobacillus niacini]KGM46318.1 RNA methyltransferase [Neobacillus niacini]
MDTTYIYTYSGYEDELSLRELEMRALFGSESQTNILESTVKIDPSRSPFIKERIGVIFEGESMEVLLEKLADFQVTGDTFKVIFVKNGEETFANRRSIEREAGLRIQGTADILHPERLLAVMHVNGRWVFGDYVKSESVWFHHQQKPHQYSTALSTRVARAVVNIAIPNPAGIKAIDPCCGIGTVLIEALSMGIEIEGSDNNPVILAGTRENVTHFGLSCDVKFKDMRDITDHYDVAIIDLPYNLCSVISPEEQLEMLQSARRFADKVVVVTVEPIDPILIEAGFEIVDRGAAKKGVFIREVIVCR